MRKTAILQVADTGPLESLVIMLRAVGYDCYLPGERIKTSLRRIGHDTVLDVRGLVDDWGYDRPMSLPDAPPMMMDTCDLYVDIKAHRGYERIVRRWPGLTGKVLWYRINGGRPEIVPGCGDEINPPCPVLTPNQWYRPRFRDVFGGQEWNLKDESGQLVESRAYCCWPPFYRADEYFERRNRDFTKQSPPMCLIHNVQGWGYGELVSLVRQLGVRCFGGGNSPDGLVKHRYIPDMLARTKAMVHLKSSDAPGYAIYECLAAACPLICTGRLIERCQMHDLLIPGQTCLTFDNYETRPNDGRKAFEEPAPADPRACAKEIKMYLDALSNPEFNKKIGVAGYHRLREVMWNENKPSDTQGLENFLKRNFK